MHKEGYYHLQHSADKEPTLAYLYDCADAKCWGFGFNIVDGGGFLPLDDLSAGTTYVPVEIKPA